MAKLRECGGCTACCFTHGVPEINKEPWQWCKECAVGHGCKVYKDRPSDCVTYTCQWRLGAFSEEDRPDRSNLVVDAYIEPTLKVEVVCLHEVQEGALASAFGRMVFSTLLRAGTVLLPIPFKGGKRVIYVPLSIEVSDEAKCSMLESGVDALRRYAVERPGN